MASALPILLGFLDPSIRTVAELEEYSGFPVLGAIPQHEAKQENLVKKGSRSHVLIFRIPCQVERNEKTANKKWNEAMHLSPVISIKAEFQ